MRQELSFDEKNCSVTRERPREGGEKGNVSERESERGKISEVAKENKLLLLF